MNRASSTSTHLSKAQVLNLIDGCAFAFHQGTQLTRYISINLSRLEGRPQDFIKAHVKLMSDWLHSKGAPRVWCWVLENPPKGHLNVHTLFHVPDELKASFSRKEKGWMGKAGMKWTQGSLDSVKMGIRPGQRDRPIVGGEYLMNVERVMAYMLKGAPEEICNDLRDPTYLYQGLVTGKRVGIAEAIGRKARAEANYRIPKSQRDSILFRWRSRLVAPKKPER